MIEPPTSLPTDTEIAALIEECALEDPEIFGRLDAMLAAELRERGYEPEAVEIEALLSTEEEIAALEYPDDLCTRSREISAKLREQFHWGRFSHPAL
jgi:hypothetical protein